MRIINSITSQANQRFAFISDTQEQIIFVLKFDPLQQKWFMDITAGNWELYNCAVTCHPNILGKYSNEIDFGVQVYTENNIDPFRIDDFESGFATFGVLSEDEVNQIEDWFNGSVQA